ncbi:hypothetical protein AB0L85_12555 [Streptomyces sp. NPDC052051]|uniref:restriction system modified-DNA reader domain-containing protein n=1 Tax=Streptomyces sp. NPDC052051 TaxID=3154649 RepID=UPI00342BF430
MTESTTSPAEAQSRTRYLLDSRRVTIADLLGSGLLKEGERLRFVRPRIGESHEATVTPRGWIRLSLDTYQTIRIVRRRRRATPGGSCHRWR